MRVVEVAMLLSSPSESAAFNSAHLVAQAALVLAERAYADGHAEDAARLVDVAHRLFGAVCEWPGLVARHTH